MGAAPPICLSFLRHLDRLQTIKEGAAQARVAQGSERKIEIPEEEERPSNVIGLMEALRRSCPFRKFHPVWIRVVRQNHRIIRIDVCDPALARDVRRRHIQVATQD